MKVLPCLQNKTWFRKSIKGTKRIIQCRVSKLTPEIRQSSLFHCRWALLISLQKINSKESKCDIKEIALNTTSVLSIIIINSYISYSVHPFQKMQEYVICNRNFQKEIFIFNRYLYYTQFNIYPCSEQTCFFVAHRNAF